MERNHTEADKVQILPPLDLWFDLPSPQALRQLADKCRASAESEPHDSRLLLNWAAYGMRRFASDLDGRRT